MKHDQFAFWLKLLIAGTTLLGVACGIVVVPFMGKFLGQRYPELIHLVIPWMTLIYLCAVPCFVAMYLCWRIASNIQKEEYFSMENAKLFGVFAKLALGNTVFFFVGNLVFVLLGMNHVGMLIMELLITFVGLAVFICTSALSYFCANAAELQEDNALTI